MRLRWSDLVEHSGRLTSRYQSLLEAGSESTFGLLCCRDTAPRVIHKTSGGGGNYPLLKPSRFHSERKLLASSLWRTEIPRALGKRANPGAVIMALNRTPCPDCAHQLFAALTWYRSYRELRRHGHRFLLACTGLYVAGEKITMVSDMRRLLDVGWELCVLELQSPLPPLGEEWEESLHNLFAIPMDAYVRLP
jgi:hypothetical protein